MNNIITDTQEEIEGNFEFALKLCEKGHTIKVITKDEKAVLLTPVMGYTQLPDDVNIPDAEEFTPDLAAVGAYVAESMREMTQDF